MRFSCYERLVEFIKLKPTQQEQLNEIIKYFMDHVKYDYVMIEHMQERLSVRYTKYTDLLFPNIDDNLRNKAINFLKNSTEMSPDYLARVENIYTHPIENDKGQLEYLSLTDSLLRIETDYIERNGLLEKGMSYHIAEFTKKLCDDVGIKALVIKGISENNMQHYWLNINIDNRELFYDIAYALYIRDNYNKLARQFIPEDWLGITPKQLYKNQPTRTIISPKGFELEYLGLNNLPINMKEFFIA